jgi:hypothetical protein
MKNLIIFSLFFAVLSCTTSKKSSTDFSIVTIEITEPNGDVINEIHLIPATDSIFLRNTENISWVVYRPFDCADCIPTILKNNKNIRKNNKIVIRHNRKRVVQNNEIETQY